MALSDWINKQQASADSATELGPVFDQIINESYRQALEATAKQCYDEICKVIAKRLVSSSYCEGHIGAPSWSMAWNSVESRMVQEVVNLIPAIRDRSEAFALMRRKLDNSLFCDNGYDGDKEWQLPLLKNVGSGGIRIQSGHGPLLYQYCHIEKDALWSEFWDLLCTMARNDGITVEARVAVSEKQKYHDREWSHSHYITFGQKVKEIYGSKHFWEHYYRISPVVWYSYSK